MRPRRPAPRLDPHARPRGRGQQRKHLPLQLGRDRRRPGSAPPPSCTSVYVRPAGRLGFTGSIGPNGAGRDHPACASPPACQGPAHRRFRPGPGWMARPPPAPSVPRAAESGDGAESWWSTRRAGMRAGGTWWRWGADGHRASRACRPVGGPRMDLVTQGRAARRRTGRSKLTPTAHESGSCPAASEQRVLIAAPTPVISAPRLLPLDLSACPTWTCAAAGHRLRLPLGRLRPAKARRSRSQSPISAPRHEPD